MEPVHRGALRLRLLGAAMTQETEAYLGDGLFARFDGYGIELRAPRENGDHFVVLEPSALERLLEFAARVGLLERSEGVR